MAENLKPYDIEYLRNQVRRCLRADLPQRGSAATSMHTTRAKGEQKLKKPSATFTVVQTRPDGTKEQVQKRKPAHAQWATTTHATATRPPGFSRELITPGSFAAAKYARAIWTLKTAHIQSILAYYSPSAHLRRNSRRSLAQRAAAAYKAPEVRERARKIAAAVTTGRSSSGELRRLFGMSHVEWRDSRHRRQLSEIMAFLALLDADSLMAWERACMALDDAT